MRVIGTAGHVDHGKSTLIQALTGIHPDRLREEREREMTIVLGFAWLTLENGEEVGIVDVPGHRDFIENMLSGVAAIDAALFVVAADEGVEAQTREHLAILDLLQIQDGIIVLTKTDLVDDPEWLDLVELDVRETLEGTALANAPVVRVSAQTGAGIPELKQTLAEILADKPPHPDLGRPRLPVDRAFTMSGFGTIVTGTLINGSLTVGDDIVILPAKISGRVRGLQTHKRKETTAIPGSRTAVNISGVDVDQLQRGDVITLPGQYKPSRRLDLKLRVLPDISQPISHNSEVKLFIGASEVVARLRVLGVDLLKPGDEGWVQLELSRPVVAVRGDRYILRRPSPGETLGGGIVIDAHPRGRHRRFDRAVLQSLESLEGGTPEDILFQAVMASGFEKVSAVIKRANLEQDSAQAALSALIEAGQVIVFEPQPSQWQPNSLIIALPAWSRLMAQVHEILARYHQAHPLRQGMPREELKSRLKLSAQEFNAALPRLIAENALLESQTRQNLPGINPIPVVSLLDHQPQYTPDQHKQAEQLLGQFQREPYAPPTIKTCLAEVGDDLYNALVDAGRLIPVSGEVVFRMADYEHMVGRVRAILDRDGEISVAQVRDAFNTSRRYVLAFLEHLDAIRLTVRAGDVRKLR